MTRAQAEARAHDRARIWGALRRARDSGSSTVDLSLVTGLSVGRVRALLRDMLDDECVTAERWGGVVRWWRAGKEG